MHMRVRTHMHWPHYRPPPRPLCNSTSSYLVVRQVRVVEIISRNAESLILVRAYLQPSQGCGAFAMQGRTCRQTTPKSAACHVQLCCLPRNHSLLEQAGTHPTTEQMSAPACTDPGNRHNSTPRPKMPLTQCHAHAAALLVPNRRPGGGSPQPTHP